MFVGGGVVVDIALPYLSLFSLALFLSDLPLAGSNYHQPAEVKDYLAAIAQ